MNKVMRLKDCEGEFLTRRQGELVRERLVKLHKEMGPGDSITLDFAGVDIMSPSFADECFGKFAERIGAQNFRSFVLLIGANTTIRPLINAVLSERISPPDVATG